jgi:hypothetical protein
MEPRERGWSWKPPMEKPGNWSMPAAAERE